jgi:hypothetical protein
VSGLETAIRNALSRADRGDATVRARIYQSARQALEAGLVKQDITDPEVIETQRVRLEHKIREIEFEERERLREEARLAFEAEAVRPVAPRPASPDDSLIGSGHIAPAHAHAHAAAMGGASRVEADLGGQTRSGSRHDDPRQDGRVRSDAALSVDAPGTSEPAADDGLGDLGAMRAEPQADRLAPADAVPQAKGRKGAKAAKSRKNAADQASAAPGIPGEKRPRRRRGFISRLFIYFTFFAFCAMGLWWAYTGGLFLTDAERDTSVPNPPATVTEEDFTGQPASPAFDPQQGFSDDWLEIYAAGGKLQAAAGAEASVETVAMADGPALRITSRSPEASGDVAIPVPVDVLRELGGKTSTIALTLQSAGDNGVQLAVRCDFASLGSCSRHRVMAQQEKSDTLFRVTFDRTLAPNQPGRIFINSDILGSRQPVLLYSVRILPGQ